MTTSEFRQMLVDAGIDEATASTISGNEKVAARASDLRRREELDAAEQRAKAAADKASGYETWYKQYRPLVDAQTEQLEQYRNRYGNLEQQAQQAQTSADPDAISREVEKHIQGRYAPMWSKLLSGTARVMQTHAQRGRKDLVDIDKLASMAVERHNGNLELAYEEWDAPNQKADVERMIEERAVQKAKEMRAQERQRETGTGIGGSTPASGPFSSNGSARTYDRAALLQTATTGVYERPS